jgi:AraC-like DNA-binding protein
MLYKEYSPIPALADYIRCIWILEGTPSTDEVETIFPDGSMELVFHYGTPMTRILEGGESYRQSQAMLVGQISTRIKLQPIDTIGVIGIRFHPWGAFAFLPMPLHEVTDRDFSLELVWGKNIKELQDRVYHQQKNEAIDAIQQFLLLRLGTGNMYETTSIRQTISHITSRQGNVRIDELAYMNNLSERQFNRRFSNMVGLSPKHFAGIIRFQHFFKEAGKQSQQNLGAIALSCGYYDQSHFIREFKQYAGMSPGEYFKGEKGLAALFLDV